MVTKTEFRKVNIDGWLYKEHIATHSNASRRANELLQKGLLYEAEHKSVNVKSLAWKSLPRPVTIKNISAAKAFESFIHETPPFHNEVCATGGAF